MELATIAYEAATLDEVIGRLKEAGVKRLIDVRAVAASRRPGFSKTILSATLAGHGIDYVHLRGLGTPPAGRQAARAGKTAVMQRIFNAHMEEPAAQIDLMRAAELAAERKSALLCLEHDHARCHRAIVADRLAAARGFTIRPL